MSAQKHTFMQQTVTLEEMVSTLQHRGLEALILSLDTERLQRIQFLASTELQDREVESRKPCPVCKGAGYLFCQCEDRHSLDAPCPHCRGTGKVAE